MSIQWRVCFSAWIWRDFEHGDDAETNVLDLNEEKNNEIIDVDDQEELIEQENETSERTFVNPSQDDKISSDGIVWLCICKKNWINGPHKIKS